MSEQRCSFVFTTYNNPPFLKLSLESLLRQRVMPAEVIVADDGSTSETADLLSEYRGILKERQVKLKHVWHEDSGYRRAQILNKALLVCEEPYVITGDADCLFHPCFVQDHLAQAEEGFFVTGTRCLISEATTLELRESGTISYPPLMNCHKRHYGFRFAPLSVLYAFLFQSKFSQDPIHGVLGCNLAFYLKDALAIKGFEESFVGWGREDNDFVLRLINNKCRRKHVFASCILYHLHHKENDKSQFSLNDQLFQKNPERVFPSKGIE